MSKVKNRYYNLRESTITKPPKQIRSANKKINLLNKLENDGFHFKCPICNIKQFLKGIKVTNHLKQTHKLNKIEARTIKRNCKEEQLKLMVNSDSNYFIDLTNNNSNNSVQIITEIDTDLQIIEDVVETVDLTIDDEILVIKKNKKMKFNSDQKDENVQIVNKKEVTENVIDIEKFGNVLNNEEITENIIEKSSDSITTIFNGVENPISSENIVEFDINRENETVEVDNILNESNVRISKENTSIIKIGCEKFHTVDEIDNALNLSLENIEDFAEKEKTVTTSEENNSNINLETDNYLEKIGSENKTVTSVQINHINEEIKKIPTVATNNMVGTVKVAKKARRIYRCKFCPGKLFKRILLAQEHFKNKHKNKNKYRIVKMITNKFIHRNKFRIVEMTSNEFIHVKDIVKDIEINTTIIETKTFKEKPFYLYGCCLCPHFIFFSLNEIFTHNKSCHEASRDLIAEMPVIPITKLIRNDSEKSELILGCLCDHIIFNKSLIDKEIINKTYKEILMERNFDCDFETKLKVIYKYGIGNGYHISFKVIIDPVAELESQEEITKENQIEEVKVTENVKLDELKNNEEEVLTTNNTKPLIINSVDDKDDKENTAKRKNEDNSLDYAREIKKKCLDKVFSLPTNKNTQIPTPTDLIEAKKPNTNLPHIEASTSTLIPNNNKKKEIKYKYEPPILVGKWGKNQGPKFPKINFNFWPFENRRNQSASTKSNFWSFRY